MFERGRTLKRARLGIVFLAFITAALMGGIFAFLSHNNYSQIAWESMADSAQINVTASDSAFTSDVKMSVEKVDNQELINLAKRTAGQNSDDVLAFNITFTDKEGKEAQPNSYVKVSIDPKDYNLNAERYALVHIDDDDNAKYLGNIAAANDSLTFYANSFSIYAIIPTTQTDQQRYARYTYEFYVDDEIVASQIVRNGDILNAPAAPTVERLIFMGWYTENDRVFNGLNQAVNIPDETTADKTIKLHAKFADKIYSVVFFNPQGNVLATKTGTNGDNINTDDIRHEVSAGHFVDAWTTDASILDRYVGCGNECEIPDDEVIPNQITGNITINNDNIKLYPIIRAVKWAHFHQNDDDNDSHTEASYTASTYAFYGHTINRPTDPTRNGYDFVGWATDEQGTNMFNFNTPLTGDIDLYAIWRPHTNTRYRIIFWKEALDNGHYVAGNYEYASYVDATGTSGAMTTATQAQINSVLSQSDMTYYELDHIGESEAIRGDGSTILDVYLKLKVYTVNFTVETRSGNRYCFNYYNTNNRATTTCQNSSHATNGNMTAVYTDSDGDTHDLTQGYSFEARMGEIISDRYPGAGEIALTYTGSAMRNIKAYAWHAVNDNPSNTIRVSKPITMTEDLLLTNKSGGTTLYLLGALSTTTLDVNYWFQKPDGSGYERSEEYSFVANTTASASNFNGRAVTGYTLLTNTPSGYESTNGNTLHFYYNRNTYSLYFYNYNAAGNTYNNIRHGASLTLYDYIPERPTGLSTAYTFQGWYTTPEYIDGTEFNLTSQVMPMSDLMLYAKWENTNYVTVSFNPNGGEPIPSQRVLYGNTASVVDDPVRVGYSFVGWRKTDGSFFSFDNIILEDTELVASWVPYDTIYVHYDPNGGEIFGQDDLSYVDTSTTAILPMPDVVPEGKYFVGWNVNGRIYYPGNVVMILLSDIEDGGDTLTITAEWGKNVDKTSYSYDPNSASGEIVTFEQEQNEAFITKTPAELGYEKPGYTFLYWNSAADGSGVNYYAGTQWAADQRAVLPNVLYAQWEINCYTVTVLHQYEDGSEYDTTETINKCYGEDYETHASTKDSDYYATVTQGQASGVMGDNDVTVIYTYKLREATITVHHVDADGNQLAEDEEVPGTLGDTYGVAPASSLLERYDYTTDKPLTGTISGDLEITITYTLKKFTLTVLHQLADGTEYDTAATQSLEYGTHYDTTPSTKDNNYEVIRTDGNASGDITADTTVTYIYAKKHATITATHKDVSGNSLANDETQDIEWGESYNTAPVDDLLEAYTYTTNGDATSGTVDGDKTVNYVYTLKQYTVTIKHVITDGETTTETQTINHGETCIAEPKSELLTAYNVERSGNCVNPITADCEIIFTYTRKQFTLTVQHQFEDGREYDTTTTESLPYGSRYNAIPSTKDNNYEVIRTNGTASGEITADTNVTFIYAKKHATITTTHKDVSGNSLANDETQDIEWGENYSTAPAESLLSAYTYTTTGDNPSGTVDGNKTVNYVYTLKQYVVTIKHVITDGETTTETVGVNHGETCVANPKAELLVMYDVEQSGDCSTPVTGNREVVFTYTRKQFTLTVLHQLADGSEYDTSSTQSLAYGAHYDTTPSTKDNNYEVIRTDGNASGDITADTTVTYIYAKKHATITTNHLYADGTSIRTFTQDIEWGENYSTTPIDDLLAAYTYTTTGDATSGVVNGDKTINYIYSIKQYTVTVEHINEAGEHLANNETATVDHGANFTANPNSELESMYTHTPESSITETITGEKTFTFVYVKRVATIIVHHVDEAGGTLAPDVTFTKLYGDNYTTEVSDQIPGNYEFASRTSNHADIAMSTPIEVTYSYQKKDASLSSSIEIVDGADTLGNDTQTSAYELVFNANISDFIGGATIEIVDTLPYAIDPENSELDGGIYDPATNTITWNESVEITEVPQTVSKTKSVSLSFVNVPHADRSAMNTVSATITLDTNKTRTVNTDEQLTVAFYGEATVHYYLENTTDSVSADANLRGLVGESFTVDPVEIEGYELVENDNSQIYVFADEAQEITYYYRAKEIPPVPENPNTNGGFNILPGIGVGAATILGFALVTKRRRP